MLWLDATSELTLYNSLRMLACAVLAVEELNRLTDRQMLDYIYQSLSRYDNTQWLLIFDNYDEPDEFDIKHYYP